MATFTPTRSQFLVGCSAAIAAMAGSSIQNLAFAQPLEAGPTGDVLVVLFLRGAWDALNVVPPIDGVDRGLYEAARPYIKIPTKGANAALPIGGHFGLHPAMAPLLDLYQAGHLAVVHAVGMNDDTRSHFDAMQFMEAGTPGLRTTATGWVTRHLQTIKQQSLLFPALATGGAVPMSLQGSTGAVAMTTPGDFRLPGDDPYFPAFLRDVYTGDSWLHQTGRQTIRSVQLVHRLAAQQYTPAKGVTYPGGDFSTALQTIAQMLKAQLSLQVATVDLGGWDTHQYQGDAGGGYLSDLLHTLSSGLRAFYDDLAAMQLHKRVTVVTMSEFGRRLNQNASGGTDHGHGSVMLVMGGEAINGGRVYGRWPGLRNDQLYDQSDLAVTTDYRQVLGEILNRRMHNEHLDVVFPGYRMGHPLGIVRPLA